MKLKQAKKKGSSSFVQALPQFDRATHWKGADSEWSLPDDARQVLDVAYDVTKSNYNTRSDKSKNFTVFLH